MRSLARPDRGTRRVPGRYARDTALFQLNRWIRSGQAALQPPLMGFNAGGDLIARDAEGNAIAGLRLPQMVLPVAAYDGGRHHVPRCTSSLALARGSPRRPAGQPVRLRRPGGGGRAEDRLHPAGDGAAAPPPALGPTDGCRPDRAPRDAPPSALPGQPARPRPGDRVRPRADRARTSRRRAPSIPALLSGGVGRDRALGRAGLRRLGSTACKRRVVRPVSTECQGSSRFT